jgi:hypothetical protein
MFLGPKGIQLGLGAVVTISIALVAGQAARDSRIELAEANYEVSALNGSVDGYEAFCEERVKRADSALADQFEVYLGPNEMDLTVVYDYLSRNTNLGKFLDYVGTTQFIWRLGYKSPSEEVLSDAWIANAINNYMHAEFGDAYRHKDGEIRVFVGRNIPPTPNPISRPCLRRNNALDDPVQGFETDIIWSRTSPFQEVTEFVPPRDWRPFAKREETALLIQFLQSHIPKPPRYYRYKSALSNDDAPFPALNKLRKLFQDMTIAAAAAEIARETHTATLQLEIFGYRLDSIPTNIAAMAVAVITLLVSSSLRQLAPTTQISALVPEVISVHKRWFASLLYVGGGCLLPMFAVGWIGGWAVLDSLQGLPFEAPIVACALSWLAMLESLWLSSTSIRRLYEFDAEGANG